MEHLNSNMHWFDLNELKEIEIKAEMLKDSSPSEEYAIAYQKISEGTRELRELIEDEVRKLQAACISQQLKNAQRAIDEGM